ncbi:hypothetical protein LVJ94_42930 [Pendulispora rubella]|uniref:Uncharacterized protein n=1 Tax=Pendulispora rubella TaxID=2741070 RepID=A0ABZ2KYQ6_9BACT
MLQRFLRGSRVMGSCTMIVVACACGSSDEGNNGSKPPPSPDAGNGTLDFDFGDGSDHGFVPVVRDVPVSIFEAYQSRKASGSLGPVAPLTRNFNEYPEEQSHWLTNSGVHPMPDGLEGKGFLLQGNNHSDDMDLHLVRKLTAADGVQANTDYDVIVTVDLAGAAPTDAVGVGGSPNLQIKARAVTQDPTAYAYVGQHVRFKDIDMSPQSGTDVGVNGVCYTENPQAGEPKCPQGRIPFHLNRGKPSRPIRVRSNAAGEFWLTVGSHSGFESFSAIYYARIQVELQRK